MEREAAWHLVLLAKRDKARKKGSKRNRVKMYTIL